MQISIIETISTLTFTLLSQPSTTAAIFFLQAYFLLFQRYHRQPSPFLFVPIIFFKHSVFKWQPLAVSCLVRIVSFSFIFFILFFVFLISFFLFLSCLFFISLFQSHSSSTFLHTGPSEVRRLHNRGRPNGQLFSSLTTVFLCPSSAFPVLSLKYFTQIFSLSMNSSTP